jgi:hypothetical protein
VQKKPKVRQGMNVTVDC